MVPDQARFDSAVSDGQQSVLIPERQITVVMSGAENIYIPNTGNDMEIIGHRESRLMWIHAMTKKSLRLYLFYVNCYNIDTIKWRVFNLINIDGVFILTGNVADHGVMGEGGMDPWIW